MAQLSEKRAHKLAAAAKIKLDHWRDLLQEVMDLCCPNRDGWTDYEKGERKATVNWDGTAAHALERGADRMMEFVPAFQDWITLKPGFLAEHMLPQAQLDKLRQELAAISAIANGMLKAGGSGFVVSAHEMFMDWLIGTGGIVVNENPDLHGPVCIIESMQLGSFYVEQGPGGVHRRYRWHEMPGEQIKHMWPDAKIPQELQEKINNKPEKSLSLFAIEYKDRDNPSETQWRYEVFCNTTAKDCHRVVERESRSHAMITPRYATMSGENMGRGPVIRAMPDIRTANKVVELTFRAAAINLLGIWGARTDSINVNTLRLAPAAIIPMRSTGGPMGADLVRLDGGGQTVDFGALMLEDLRLMIRKALYDNTLPNEIGPVRSATEIAARLREVALDLGGAYGRLIDEFVVPLVQRLIDIMHSRGLIQVPHQIDNFAVQVQVSSPVAREQELRQVGDAMQWVEALNVIGGRELVLLSTMMEDFGPWLADKLGIDPNLVRPEEGRKEMQTQMANVMTMQGGGALSLQGGQAGAAPQATGFPQAA